MSRWVASGGSGGGQINPNDPALKAAYGRPTDTVALLGDSITAAGGMSVNDPDWGGTGNVFQSPFGWSVWALNALSWRAVLLRNAGVSGNTTAQILARVQSDVLAYSPSWCTVLGGRNDIDGLVPAATTVANLEAICAALLAGGTRPILCTILPCQDESATQIAQREAINTQLIAYARATPGVVLCDWASVWTDPATGHPLAGLTTDGKHPTRDGATRLGAVLAQVLDPLLPGTADLIGWNGDSRSLGSNPCMTGGGGYLGSGATGTVADGWTVASSGGTITAVASKVARTDGQPGEWQQIKNPGGACQLYYTGASATKGTLWTPGATRFWVEAEFERDDDWSGITLFGMQSYIADQSGNAYASMDFSQGSHGGGSIFPRRGVLRSPVGQLTSSATAVGIGLKFEGATGTLRVGRVAVRAA